MKYSDQSDLVRRILFRFIQGYGQSIDEEKLDHDDKDGSQFREKLSELIHILTGKKPRLAKARDKWAIFPE